MYYRDIDDELRVGLSVPYFAEELFVLTDTNREYLRQWLPWLDSIQEVNDTREFIRSQLERFSRGEAVHQTIFFQGRVAGVIAFNVIDNVNHIGHVGYWLGREFTGKGIMVKAVKDLIDQGFTFWNLQKIEVRCAVDNVKSRAIPEKLGFDKEGTIRRAARVYDRYDDYVVYGLLK